MRKLCMLMLLGGECYRRLSRSHWVIVVQVLPSLLIFTCCSPCLIIGQWVTLLHVFGAHFLGAYVCSIASDSLCFLWLLCPWGFSHKNIGVSCHFPYWGELLPGDLPASTEISHPLPWCVLTAGALLSPFNGKYKCMLRHWEARKACCCCY